MRHHGRPTVWARVATTMAARARALGIDLDDALETLGLRDASTDPDARAPLEAVYGLLEAIDRESGDPCIAFRLSAGLDVQAFDVLGLLALASPTLGRALDAMLRYQRLFAEGERWTVERRADARVLVYEPFGPPRRAHALMAELGAFDLVVNAATLTGGGPFEGARVRFRHAIADPLEHARWLGVPVEPEAPRAEIVLPSALLARPIASGHDALAAFFERHLDERVRSLSATTFAARVRDALIAELPREPSLARIARRLRASPRTVQRHLADEGTSLRALTDEARRAKACALLEAGASIAEVTHLLGYAEPAAFHRAFRRWTGTTPEAYRARRD